MSEKESNMETMDQDKPPVLRWVNQSWQGADINRYMRIILLKLGWDVDNTEKSGKNSLTAQQVTVNPAGVMRKSKEGWVLLIKTI